MRINCMIDPIKLDRLPPHEMAMEQGVLGCQLISPNDCIGEAVQKLRGKTDAYYDLRHQTIQDELFAMYDERTPIDLVTFQQRLKDKGLLDQIGGIAYLSQLQDAVPSAANLSYYLDIVCEKQLLRSAIQVCTKAVGRIYDFEGDVEQLMEEVERDIMAIRGGSHSQPHCRTSKELVDDAIADIEKLFLAGGKITGIGTGFPDLDRLSDGMHGSELIVVAAYPSVGKTSLAMNIVEHVALELKLPVGIFSAEMSARRLMRRALCSQARVNLRNVRDGFMTEGDFPKLTNAAGRLSVAPIYIDDTADMAVPIVRAKARRMVQQFGIKLFVADYAQMFTSPGAENRTNEVDQVSKCFKNIAKEFDVPVLLLSQLNEQGNLKHARALGEDADGLWELKRQDEKDESSEADSINLVLKKQRDGERNAVVHLTFLTPYTRFESAAKVCDADIPTYDRD